MRRPGGKEEKRKTENIRKNACIPLEGVVAEGESMVNQAALTGESVAVHKETGITVFAGTTIDEGELTIAGSRRS